MSPAASAGRRRSDASPPASIRTSWSSPFPPWDCLPYERASPSAEVMGRRMAALRRLAERADAPCLVISTPDALLQRVPPRQSLAEAGLELAVGDAVDPEALRDGLRRAGYEFDDRVDEAGECAVRGQVIDVFPAGAATPFRLEHEDGRITVIRAYDPVSQRTEEEVERLRLDPATELPPDAFDDGADEGGPRARPPDLLSLPRHPASITFPTAAC